MRELGEVVTISEPVDPDEEMGALTYLIARTEGLPAIVFTNPESPHTEMRNDLGMSHLWNPIGGSWRRLALMFDLDPALTRLEIVHELKSMFGRLIPPVEVPIAEAPVLQNRIDADAVNLMALPFPRHWSKDGGRYAGTHDVVFSANSDGLVNVGTHRMMLLGPREASIMISPGTDTWANMTASWERGEPHPIAAAWGVHPLLVAVGGSNVPAHISEYDYLGGLIGEPVQVVRSPSSGLVFPAAAEFVIEGHIRPNHFKEEGPFGEFTAHYRDKTELYPVVTVEAVWHRSDPVMTNALLGFPPSNEEQTTEAALRAARIWQQLDSLGVRGVTGVYCPPTAACGWAMTIVSLRQQFPGHSQQVLQLAGNVPAGAHFTKWIVVVDDDVDPTDLEQVVWAMATRCPPSERILIQNRTWNNTLDPAMDPGSTRVVGSRAFIDATRDFEHGDHFSRTLLTKPMYEKVAARWASLNIPAPIPKVDLFDRR
ncbi:UbiD family decarboxylase [Kribbella sp. CA-253562]|uniref:UbiD family decarboxylase n=1 Tax=Kribbella sp. CA-253562 TaxID=3239942 RepID=UPI003D8EAE98